MPKKETTTETDGRRLRSERSRQAIIRAFSDLVDEGTLVPTAQQVSDKAGVGIRTVFRHISDMESLFNEADAQARADYESLFIGGDRRGTLPERIKHAVERRSHGFESISNTILSALGQRWKYGSLRQNYARYQRGLRRDLEDWLPEIKSLPKSQLEAVHAVASYEMWNRLRDHQGLGKKASIDIVVGLINGSLPEF